jgi:hypothetical protein
MAIETQSPLTLTGTISPTIVIDHDQPPTTIIKETDHFHVVVNWNVQGSALPMLGGQFEVRACFESIGPGDEKAFGPIVVPVSAGVGSLTNRNYTADIVVLDHGLKPGAYDLVAVLTYSNNGVPGNIAGFSDEKIIQVYTPSPAFP